MPELPDVEILRRYSESTVLYQEITSLEVMAERILEHIQPAQLEDRLVGNSFLDADRHGKHLFLELSSGYWLNLHFGMTGDLKYYKDTADEPEYSKLIIYFDNSYHLALIMPRKLGKVRLLEDPENFVTSKRLGPDAISSSMDYERFKGLFMDSRSMVKSAFMDQQKIAGIGNVYSDEILYQAGIHPRRQFKELSDQELHKLYNTMQDVLQTAIDFQAKPETFPEGTLIKHRREGENCPKCSGRIERIEVSGRAGYYCPTCQA